ARVAGTLSCCTARRRMVATTARGSYYMTQRSFDVLELTVFAQAVAMIAEEMGSLLERSAISPNIRERRDASCAIFDAKGQMVAQAAHIPVHLGAMPESVAAVRARGARA